MRRLAVTQPRDAHARDRRDQLRGDRARVRRRPIWRTPRSASCLSKPRTCRDSAALLVPPAAARRRDAVLWAVHAPEPRGPHARAGRVGDRPRALSRPRRGPADPPALDGRALSGTTGVVLDPIVSLRQRIRIAPGATVRLSFATGLAADRETAWPSRRNTTIPSAARARSPWPRARAERAAPPGISADDALLFERLASRVLCTDGSLRRHATTLAERAGPAGTLAARDLRRPADRARAGRR